MHYHTLSVVMFANGKKTKQPKMGDASEQKQIAERQLYIK